MSELTVVKASDLTNLFQQISELRSEIKALRTANEDIQAFTIEETAKKIGLHYNSVRKLIIRGDLFAKYLHGDSGKCIVPFWSIKNYLQSKETQTH